MQRLPDLDLLAAFLALSRTLSFTEAAREVGLTQSAVSHRIRRLEEQLGYRLFERSTTRVVPTAAGEDLRARLEPVLQELEAIFAPEPARAAVRLQVEMESSFARNWLTPRLGRFTERHPQISIDLRIRNEGFAFGQGTALAIRWGKGHWPDYSATWLLGMRFTPTCSEGFLHAHPLRSPADLLNCVLLHDRSTAAWSQWLKAAGVAGRPRHEGHVLHDTALLEHAVDQGHGVAMLSPLMTQAGSGRVAPFPALTIEEEGAGYYILKASPRLRGAAAHFESWLQAEAAAV